MNLADLILARKNGRGYIPLSEACGGKPTGKRLQQIATTPLKEFPDVTSIRGMARGLGVTEWAVLRAAAESLGLEIANEPSRLEMLLPRETANLTDEQVATVVQMIQQLIATAPTRRLHSVAEPPAVPAKRAARNRKSPVSE